jgi:hypothetical protein
MDKPQNRDRRHNHAHQQLQDHNLRGDSQETITHIQAVDSGLESGQYPQLGRLRLPSRRAGDSQVSGQAHCP